MLVWPLVLKIGTGGGSRWVELWEGVKVATNRESLDQTKQYSKHTCVAVGKTRVGVFGFGEYAGAGKNEVAIGGELNFTLASEDERLLHLVRFCLNTNSSRLSGLNGVNVSRHGLFAIKIA